MKANERQVGGAHYRSGMQHWDLISQYQGSVYLIGCITKYLTRWRKKNGLQDLEKALHYLDKLMELVQAQGTADPNFPRNSDGEIYASMYHQSVPKDVIRVFAVENDIGRDEFIAIENMLTFSSMHELNIAHEAIERLIVGEKKAAHIRP